MEIRHGKYFTKYSEKNEIWNTYYKNTLIASTPRDLWEYEDIEFDSRQAGEALLYTTIELTAAISESVDKNSDKEDDDSLEDMHYLPEPKKEETTLQKTDDGDVKDVETPSDKIQYNHSEVDPEEQELIKMITELLEKAFELQHSDTDEADDELHDVGIKIDAAVKEYTKVQGLKLERKLYNLLNKAKYQLNDNLDCTAELNEAEKIIEALRNL